VIDGVPLCFAAVGLNNGYEIRICNLRTGEEVMFRDRTWSSRNKDGRLRIPYYEDKTLECVAVPILKGKPLLLAAGPYSFVSKWTWPPEQDPVSLDMEEPVGNEYVHSLAVGTLTGRAVVAAGNECGLLAVWDLQTDELLYRIERAHSGPISALAVSNWFGSGEIISAGAGYVRVWSASLTPMFDINIEQPVSGLVALSEQRLIVATDRGLIMITARDTGRRTNRSGSDTSH